MRMKIKTFMFAALAAFATLFAGCSDDENKPTVTITEREEILSRANIR